MMQGSSEAEPRSNPFEVPVERGGNVYDKYATSNPIVRRLMAGFMSDLDELVARTDAGEAHEVGCGEGELSIRLARRGIRVRGTDASPQVLEEARRRAAAASVEVDFEATAVEQLAPDRHAAELVVCCEVLGHLDDRKALDVLAGWLGHG
jgi:2-polyprenyl-3-methyl-5-hydroxy-6-metoxy-1,4-benzoquinol methylase